MKQIPHHWKQAFASNHQQAPTQAIAWIGVACMLGFVFFFWISRDLSRICEVTGILVLALCVGQIWRHDRREWLWLLMLGWLIFMVIVNYLAILTYPQLDVDHIRYSRYYLRLFLFLVAGWWLGGNLNRAFLFLGLATLGIFLDIFVNYKAEEWLNLFSGVRVDFTFRNAQHTAILFSLILIGALCFWKRFFRVRPRWLQPGVLLIWLAILIFSFLIITGTQTRQVVPAFFLCMCTAGVWALIRVKTGYLQLGRVFLFCALAGTFVLILVMVFKPFQGLQQRFEGEWNTISQAMHGEFNNIPARESTGQRIYYLQLAWKKILQSPLVGHGAATRYKLFEESNLPQYIKDNFHHFHNGYLEMGVAFGLPGLFMLPILLAVLGVRLIRARQKNLVPEDFMLFGLLSLLFFATVNLFESYVMYRTGYFIMAVVGGAIYTLTRPWTFKRQGLVSHG